MKKLLRKWLGITELTIRVNTIEAWIDIEEKQAQKPIEDLPYPSGGSYLERGMWEHIYAIIKYLKVYPKEIWENDESMLPIEQPKVREMTLVKNKK